MPWGFAGKREIDELVYFGLRFYQPQLGRWLTPDPLYFEDGPNLYAYLKNNPFTHFDPYGLEGISWADSSMDFGKAFLSSYPKSTIDPIGACVNANCYPTGAAYWGEMTGRTAGLLTNAVLWECALAYRAGVLGGECAFGCGNYIVNRYMVGRTALAVEEVTAVSLASKGSQVGRATLSVLRTGSQVEKTIDSISKMGNAGKTTATEVVKQSGRNRFVPDRNATGAHSVFRRDPSTGKINHYETFRHQTNGRNPNPWESVASTL